jgi:hypothetical protein
MQEILKAKDAQRRAHEALPWEEKIRIVEMMMRESPAGKWQDRQPAMPVG